MNNNTSKEITISVPGTIIQSIFEISFPFFLFFMWVKYFKGKIYTSLIGMAGFICSIISESIFVYLIRLIFSEKLIIFYIILGISPGLFEETGRYVCLRFFLSKEKNKNVSVSYGIGHGGMESIYLGIFAFSSLFVKDTLINEGVLKQSIPFYICMLGACERFFAIIIHISFSVIIYKSINEKNIYFYIFAIISHDIANISPLLYQIGVLTSIILVDIIFAIFSSILAVLSFKFIYKNLKEIKDEEIIIISKKRN